MKKVKKVKVTVERRLAEDLHKSIKRRFPTRRVIVGGVDDTWSADLVDMQSFSKYDKFKYLFDIIDLFSKYAWSIPLHDKTSKAIVESLDIINERTRNLRVDRGGDFTIRPWITG